MVVEIENILYIATISGGLIRNYKIYKSEDIILYAPDVAPFIEIIKFIYSSSEFIFIFNDNPHALCTPHGYTFDGHFTSISHRDFDLNRTILERYITFESNL
jgi:hypothetical protein